MSRTGQICRNFAGSLAPVWLVAMACPACADQDPTAIVVTAEKRTEPLAVVPMTIAALGRDQLAALRIDRPEDLGKAVPGFVTVASAYDTPIYSLRGVSFFSEALGAPPAVRVYLDQVPLPYSAMAEGAALDVERAEVLKGPQGPLFGQNATGGLVNFIPVQPSRDLAAGLETTYGRFNAVSAKGYLGGALSDTVSTRLAVSADRSDGDRFNHVGQTADRNGARRFVAVRLLTDWKPGATIKVQLNLNGWLDRSDTAAKQKIGYAPLTPLSQGGYPDSPGLPGLQAALEHYPNAPDNDRAVGFDPGVSLRRNDRFGQAAVRAVWDMTPRLSLTSITAFSRLDVDRPNDIDGTIYPDIFIAVKGDITSISQELRLAGASGDARLHWMVGGNADHDVIHDAQIITMNGTNSGFGTIRFQHLANLNNQQVWTGAGFGSLDFALIDGLKLAGALRYTERGDRFSGCLADTGDAGGIRDGFAALSSALSGSPTVIAPGACVTLGDDDKPSGLVHRSLDEHNVSFRTSIAWQVAPQYLAYASVTQGYKAGSFDTLPAIRPAQLDPVQQERLLAYEAGLRGSWFGQKLRAGVAAFAYDYRHKQIAGYVNTGAPFGLLPALVSIPRSRIIGAEAEAHWQDALYSADFGASWLDSRVLGSFTTSSPLGGTVDIHGEAFHNTPRWQLSLNIERRFAVSAGLTGFVGGDSQYQGPTTAAFGGGALFRIEGYALVGLRGGIGAASGKWRLELWGRNVFNRYYWTSVEHVEDTVTRLPGAPATWGATFRTRL